MRPGCSADGVNLTVQLADAVDGLAESESVEAAPSPAEPLVVVLKILLTIGTLETIDPATVLTVLPAVRMIPLLCSFC